MTSNIRLNAMVALVWGAAGALATAAVLPYAFDLVPEVLAKIKVPLAVVALAQTVQSGALLFALGFAGLSCSTATTLDSPLVRGWFQSWSPLPRWKQRLTAAVALGSGAGGLLLVVASAFASVLPAARVAMPEIALWKRLLASFYGGITEECLVHLFLMSVIAWILLKVFPAASSSVRTRIIWLAVVSSALLFALGHLPAVASVWPLTSVVVLRTLVLNGLGGVLFGWLFWRWGFEFAVVAHLCADLVLHGLGS